MSAAPTSDRPTRPAWSLDVSLREGRLTATLEERRPGGWWLLVRDSRTFDAPGVAELASQVAALQGCASHWGERDGGSAETLRPFAELLFCTLLPAAVARRLREAASGPLALALDASLASLPWELLHDGRSYLGLRHDLGRWRRTDARHDLQPARVVRRMLVVCDPLGDLMGAYYEGLMLRDELGAPGSPLKVDLLGSEVRVAELRRRLRDYDAIHYAGHGERGGDGGSGWLLEDGRLTVEALSELSGSGRWPALVFSNACRSAAGVPAGMGSAGHGAASIVDAFFEGGAHHVIGPRCDVPDEPACHFALAFHRAVMAGAPVGVASRGARLALLERYGPGNLFWAAYVLYGDPTAPLAGFGDTSEDSASEPSAALNVGRVEPAAGPDAASRPALVRLRGSDAASLPSKGVSASAFIPTVFGGWAPALALVAASFALGAGLRVGVGGSPEAPAAAVRAAEPHLEVEAVGPDGRRRSVASGAALDPGESVRLTFAVGGDPGAALWLLSSSGEARRLYPPAHAAPLRAPLDPMVWPPSGSWRAEADGTRVAFVLTTNDPVGAATPLARSRTLERLLTRAAPEAGLTAATGDLATGAESVRVVTVLWPATPSGR